MPETSPEGSPLRRVVIDRDAGTVTDTRVVTSGGSGTFTVGGVTYPMLALRLERTDVRTLPPEPEAE